MPFRPCPSGCGRFLSADDGNDRCLQCLASNTLKMLLGGTAADRGDPAHPAPARCTIHRCPRGQASVCPSPWAPSCVLQSCSAPGWIDPFCQLPAEYGSGTIFLPTHLWPVPLGTQPVSLAHAHNSTWLLALRHFRPLLLGKHVLVRMDNTAAVSYINRLGGIRSHCMSQLARHLLLWSHTQFKSLRAVHIPGKLNRGSRRSLTTAHIPRRVATPSRDDPADVESIRGSSGRPVCFPRVLALPDVLFPDPEIPSDFRGERNSGLAISSSDVLSGPGRHQG